MKPRVKWEVGLGSILVIITMVVSTVANWVRLEEQISQLKAIPERVRQIELKLPLLEDHILRDQVKTPADVRDAVKKGEER